MLATVTTAAKFQKFLAPEAAGGAYHHHQIADGSVLASPGLQAFVCLASFIIVGLAVLAGLHGLVRVFRQPKRGRPAPPSPAQEAELLKARARRHWGLLRAHVRQMAGAPGATSRAEAEEATAQDAERAFDVESPARPEDHTKDAEVESTNASDEGTDGAASEDGSATSDEVPPPLSPKQLLLDAQLRELADHARFVSQQRSTESAEGDGFLGAWLKHKEAQEEAFDETIQLEEPAEGAEENYLGEHLAGGPCIPGNEENEEEGNAEKAHNADTEQVGMALLPHHSADEKDGAPEQFPLGGDGDPQGWLSSLDLNLAQQLTEKDAELDALYKEVEEMFRDAEHTVAKTRRPPTPP